MGNEEYTQHIPQTTPIDFEQLVTHIPVGVAKCLMDDGYTLLYGNEYFYTLFGYTPEQFRIELNNKITNAIQLEERGSVSQFVDGQRLRGASEFHIEHRITRRDGVPIWFLVAGRFTAHHGAPAAYCIMMDITDRKQMEAQLRMEEERFRLAFAQTDSTLFDYDIVAKTMTHADKGAERYGLSPLTHNVPEFFVEKEIIHPDSVADFLEMYHNIHTGAPSASCVAQARMADGQYAWRKIMLSSIYDQTGRPVRAVGMLEDIDEQTRRENQLLAQSQRDALTGLYHKGATEQEIRARLETSDCSGSLLLVDVDYFKSVNDQYGHLFGDLVLAEGAHRIAALCQTGDILGRIGGDEFLLYVDETLSQAVEQATAICEAFGPPFCRDEISVQVTCTVGLVHRVGVEDCFEDLYQKADMALYQAKHAGRNRFYVYHSGLDKKNIHLS